MAEHIMLVDLCRNDIARVCVPENQWRETLSKMGMSYIVITDEEFSP